jgi:N utilization substance protein B
MGSRRQGRELALQVLYQLDFQPDLGAQNALVRFFSCFAPEEDAEARAFTERLVRGVGEAQGQIDQRIGQASRNWRLERMARVDRNLLRMAVFELCFEEDVPPKVAINEAIEIAKRFGTQETPAFVNGVLDRVLEGLEHRPERE